LAKEGLMIEPLGWGLIGTGAIAETFASDLEFTETGRVAAVGSRRLDTAKRLRRPVRHSQPARQL
jgi:hypothetical protein